jgi:hypothetical protein
MPIQRRDRPIKNEVVADETAEVVTSELVEETTGAAYATDAAEAEAEEGVEVEAEVGIEMEAGAEVARNHMLGLQAFSDQILRLATAARDHHVEYFVLGLFMATHLPSLSWLFFGYVFTVPILILVQNPTWFHNPFILSICACSQIYAIYSISKMLMTL